MCHRRQPHTIPGTHDVRPYRRSAKIVNSVLFARPLAVDADRTTAWAQSPRAYKGLKQSMFDRDLSLPHSRILFDPSSFITIAQSFLLEQATLQQAFQVSPRQGEPVDWPTSRPNDKAARSWATSFAPDCGSSYSE